MLMGKLGMCGRICVIGKMVVHIEVRVSMEEYCLIISYKIRNIVILGL